MTGFAIPNSRTKAGGWSGCPRDVPLFQNNGAGFSHGWKVGGNFCTEISTVGQFSVGQFSCRANGALI
jgi:hypothetical protein